MWTLNAYVLVSTTISLFSLITGQRVPSTPCPDVFQYYHQRNGDIYGIITIPYDGSTNFDLSVNASMKRIYTDKGKAGLHITLMTPGLDVAHQDAKTLRYKVSFPFQQSIPKITKIVLNNREYCSGPPEKLIPGTPGISNLWAAHNFYFQITDKNEQFKPPPEHSFEATEEPITSRPPEIISISSPLQQPLDNSVETTLPSRHQNQECGVSKNVIVPFILGGSEVSDGAFPWLTAMFVSKEASYEYKCTANLVSEKHVLTAARCVNYYKVQVVETEQILFIFGKTDLKKWATSGAVTRGASKVQTHPEFKQDSGDGDISIITLDRPLQFSNTIAPICLWSEINDFPDIIGQRGTVAGWGADEGAQKSAKFSISVAKWLDMPVVSQDDCLFSNLSFYSLTSDTTFCAGQRDGTGTCIGDNGAGFMINRKQKYYLRGLASVSLTDGDGKCDLSFFMIFSDIAKYTDWIKTNMKE